MSARTMQILAELAARRALDGLGRLCEEQRQVSTGRLYTYVTQAGDILSDYAFELRREHDALAQRCQELEKVSDDAIGRNTFLETECDDLRSELAQLRRWEKEVRENSPLLIRLDAVENERDNLKAAFTEWIDKTEWVQKAISTASLPIRYLGMHRADAMRAEIERLQAINYRQEQQIAALTADPNGWQAGYNKGRQDGTKTRLSELEQERRINRELRDQLREQREDYAVGAALQRAAGELPEGFEIRVEVERGAGTARLYGPNGDEIEGIEGDGLADEINEAIDTAMEAPR